VPVHGKSSHEIVELVRGPAGSWLEVALYRKDGRAASASSNVSVTSDAGNHEVSPFSLDAGFCASPVSESLSRVFAAALCQKSCDKQKELSLSLSLSLLFSSLLFSSLSLSLTHILWLCHHCMRLSLLPLQLCCCPVLQANVIVRLMRVARGVKALPNPTTRFKGLL
jgi:hypothetical protein